MKKQISEIFEYKKPKLEIGKEYKLAQSNGIYLGSANAEHVFVIEDDNERTYAFLHDNWIREINGSITYSPVSSFRPSFIPGRYLREQHESQSRLLNILKELGVEI